MSFNIDVFFGVVHWPIAMNLDAIPQEYKNYQVAWLNKWIEQKENPNYIHLNAVDEAKAILSASKYNANYNKQFKERIKELDNIRNENILDLDFRFEDIMNEG